MKITLYESPALFHRHGGEWNELLVNSHANEIFLTCDWQATWWEAYHPGRMWALVMQADDGQWIGAAPWFIEPDTDGARVVRTIGCVDVTDYLDIIVRRGHEEAVYRAVAEWLAAHVEEYDIVRLCNIPQRSPTLETLPPLTVEHGMAALVRLQEVCPVVALPDSFEAYVAGLDKKNRHELRRKLRRAANQTAWYMVEQGHDLQLELREFLRLMAASSPRKAAFLEDAANRRFLELMVPRMAARGWLELAFLTVDGERAAAYLNFDYNNHILVYNSGHNPTAHGGFSPGIILLARLIEHAIERRRDAFDFLRGDEPYKYDMGGKDTNVYQVSIAPLDILTTSSS